LQDTPDRKRGFRLRRRRRDERFLHRHAIPHNQAFVVMEYFGYLRRDPDALYLNWIQVLDANRADSRHVVNCFVNSTEYRNRFAQ
jgi:hypothetical protein